MLLIGKETKVFKLKVNTIGFETNNCFTKLLGTPLRDTSIAAAQRAKSATSRSTAISDKLSKLNSLKEELHKEKERFDHFTKTSDFFKKVEKIVELRFKTEENSAIKIQSVFRGYLTRKVYIQKRIEIDREITKRLIEDLQSFVSTCHNIYLGHKAAIIIQKHRRRVLAQRILKSSLKEVRQKISNENELVSKIQKKFRQFLSHFKYRAAKIEKFKEDRLLYFRIRVKARVILRFLKRTAERLAIQREEQRKNLIIASRRKGIRNHKRSRLPTKKTENFLARLSQVFSSESEEKDLIPNVFSIFRVKRGRNRPLTPSEHTQLQTEASSIRRRSVSIKRSLPKVDQFVVNKEVKQEDKKINQKVVKRTEFYLKDTECSYNRVVFRDQPPTPEFLKSEKKSRKINWTFLKPTVSSEIYKASKLSQKSTVMSTHFTRTPSPSMSSRPKVAQSGQYSSIVNPTFQQKQDCYSILR